MSSQQSPFTVGQQLWWVTNEKMRRALTSSGSRVVEVTKVGRRWVQLSNGYRIDRHSWAADGRGYASPGQVYLSKEAYEQSQRVQSAWEALRRKIGHTFNAPAHLGLSEISEIAQLIFPDQVEGRS